MRRGTNKITKRKSKKAIQREYQHEAKMNRLAYLEAKETGDWGYFERKRDRERREIAKEVEIETLGYDPDYHFDVDDFDDIV